MDPTLSVPMMTTILLRGNRHVWQYLTDEESDLKTGKYHYPEEKY